jgi:tetratricopeptide (TPR) repeat protein
LSDPELRAIYDKRLAPPAAVPSPEVKREVESEADIHFARGKAALEQLDFAGALESFEEARRRVPEVAEYELYAGLARYNRNRTDPENIQTAVLEIQRAAEIDPESDLAYYHLGQIYREQGLLNKARTMYARAVRVNPQNVLARRALEALGGAVG